MMVREHSAISGRTLFNLSLHLPHFFIDAEYIGFEYCIDILECL